MNGSQLQMCYQYSDKDLFQFVNLFLLCKQYRMSKNDKKEVKLEEKKEPKHEQKKVEMEPNEAFFKSVEAGDIALFDIFPEAMAVFGFTKVGKTSSCHFLSNSTMRSEMLDGFPVWKPSTRSFATALVGFTNQSQTEIPNIFNTTVKIGNQNRPVFLLDQPGYGDSYGFHRIFSNGYFHYRTFSKTPKLKFVIAFDLNFLSNTGEKVFQTLEHFINSFVNYNNIKEQILKATSFLVTKVDPTMQITDIHTKFEKLVQKIGNVTKEKAEDYREIVHEMINKKRVFVIRKPDVKNIGVSTTQNSLLTDIYKSTEFWVRKVVNENLVEMDQINFSVSDEILDKLKVAKKNALFVADYHSFIKAIQDRINEFFLKGENSFSNLIATLKRDAEGDVESHDFLEIMKEFVTKNYHFFEDEFFKEKRNLRLKTLFEINDEFDSMPPPEKKIKAPSFESNKRIKEEIEREAKNTYFIKKFNALDYIYKKALDIQDKPFQRNTEWLETVSSECKDIFKQLNKLRTKKEDSEEIIYKYCYLILRLIEEAKILTLILYTNESAEKDFKETTKKIVQFHRILNDSFITQLTEYNIQPIKKAYLERMNIEGFEIVTPKMIDFFEGVKEPNERIVISIANVIMKHCRILIHSSKENTNQFLFAIEKLLNYRKKVYESYMVEKIDQKNREIEQHEEFMEKGYTFESLTFLLFEMSNMLAHFLYLLKRNECARDVYNSVKNVEMVLEMFDQDLKAMKDTEEGYATLLIQTGNYALECHRSQFSFYQKAYAKAKTYGQLQTATKKIVESSSKKNIVVVNNLNSSEDEDAYLKDLGDGVLISALSKQSEARIRNVYQKVNKYLI